MNYGRLIVINTEQKLNAFSGYLDTMGYASDRLWIGATDKADEGTWVWLNGQGVDQSYWDDVILNDFCKEDFFAFTAECGRIQYRTLSDDTCGISQAYVCERPDIV
ncbi:lectin BRA-3-like [Pecten maximus]|uniref:lectin BRA-3-like n=1 Tax=Pecten maximus TaxID=6579 RepID=UPI001458D21A|nr:lectin BRA-3-like [Pecten maximus]